MATSVSSRRFGFLEATLGSFGPADMFAVDRHLWVRWDIEDGEVRFHCRYYKERPGKVEETGTLIVETMKEFVDGLRRGQLLTPGGTRWKVNLFFFTMFFAKHRNNYSIHIIISWQRAA